MLNLHNLVFFVGNNASTAPTAIYAQPTKVGTGRPKHDVEEKHVHELGNSIMINYNL